MMFTFFSINNFSRTFIFAFLLFFLFLLLFNGPLFGGGGWQAAKEVEDVDTSGEIILARLSRAMAELSALKAQNEELRGLIQNYIPLESLQSSLDARKSQINSKEGQKLKSGSKEGGTSSSATPDAQFELARRKLKKDIGELWNFLKHNTNHSTAAFAQELKNSLLFDLGKKYFILEPIFTYLIISIFSLPPPRHHQQARRGVAAARARLALRPRPGEDRRAAKSA